MNKVLILILAVGAGIFFFLKDPYEKNISYDAKIFSLHKKQEYGDTSVYIYVNEQGDNDKNSETIHLVRIDQSLPKERWVEPMERVFKTYNMSGSSTNPLEASGYQKRSGFFFSTYGKPTRLNNEDIMIMYQMVSDDDTGGLYEDTDVIYSKLNNAYFL